MNGERFPLEMLAPGDEPASERRLKTTGANDDQIQRPPLEQ